jgi:hypothetical protein
MTALSAPVVADTAAIGTETQKRLRQAPTRAASRDS